MKSSAPREDRRLESHQPHQRDAIQERRARNLREIGQQLGVAHLLEGSVQRAANRVRVNAQLIDARTDAHLWAQTYDRDLADVFAIQSEIAKAIADQLQAKLSPPEKTAIERRPRPTWPPSIFTAEPRLYFSRQLSPPLVNKTCGRPLSFLTRQ